MWSSIIGLLASVIGGAVSSSADKGYEEDLQSQIDKQKTAPALSQAESIYRALANTGLPGYETEKQEIETSVPTTLNQLRESVQSGSMVDALTSIYTKSQGAQRELSRANERQMLSNKQQYGQFLAGSLAPAQERVQSNLTALEVAKAREEKQRAKDKLAFSQAGAGVLGNTLNEFMGMSGLDSYIAGLFGNKGSEKKKEPSLSFTEPTQSDYFGNSIFGNDLYYE